MEKVRNFEKFEKGHWYIFTGNEPGGHWSLHNKMDFVLEHQPFQCCDAGIYDRPADASFFNPGEEVPHIWAWGEDTLDLWIEIEDPEIDAELSHGELFYNKSSNMVYSNNAPVLRIPANVDHLFALKNPIIDMDILNKENAELKEKIKLIDEENAILTKEISKVDRKLLRIKIENEKLEKEIDRLTDIKLRNRNMQLNEENANLKLIISLKMKIESLIKG